MGGSTFVTQNSRVEHERRCRLRVTKVEIGMAFLRQYIINAVFLELTNATCHHFHNEFIIFDWSECDLFDGPFASLVWASGADTVPRMPGLRRKPAFGRRRR